MIYGNLATYNKRFDILSDIIPSILENVDELRVYLNPPFDKIPKILNNKKIQVIKGEKDIRAHGKFYFIDQSKDDDIYFTLDDDFIYRKKYFENHIEYVKRYPDNIICSHGHKIISKPINGYLTFGKRSPFFVRYQIGNNQPKDIVL